MYWIKEKVRNLRVGEIEAREIFYDRDLKTHTGIVSRETQVTSLPWDTFTSHGWSLQTEDAVEDDWDT